MKIFTTKVKSNKDKETKIKLWVVIIWLAIWSVASLIVDSKLLLASPIDVIIALFKLVITLSFYNTILFSLIRIVLGLILACALGVVFAALSHRFRLFKEFILLPVNVIKSIPVASFIVLVLVWVRASNLSIIISFLISFPIFYLNILKGLKGVDVSILEMAKVFNITPLRRVRYIYIPSVLNDFKTSVDLAIGYAFKAGIAAEIIGLIRGSIGEKIYQAKIYLETDNLFAWTIVIILVSVAVSKLLLALTDLFYKKMEGR